MRLLLLQCILYHALSLVTLEQQDPSRVDNIHAHNNEGAKDYFAVCFLKSVAHDHCACFQRKAPSGLLMPPQSTIRTYRSCNKMQGVILSSVIFCLRNCRLAKLSQSTSSQKLLNFSVGIWRRFWESCLIKHSIGLVSKS